MIYGGDAPVIASIAAEVVEPGDRAIVDNEGEAGFRIQLEREGERGLDGAAVADRNDVAVGVLARQPHDGSLGALNQVAKALAARRLLVGRAEPEMMTLLATGEEFLAREPLPFAEMLFSEFRDDDGFASCSAHGSSKGGGRLLGASEVAGDPQRIGWKALGHGGEDVLLTAVAVEIVLTVDAAAVGHRSVTHPPPAHSPALLSAPRNPPP